MGGAATALSQDAMALSINPAASVLVGNRIDFGMEYFRPNRSSSFGPVRYDGNDTSFFLIPDFAYNQKINEQYSAGIAVYGHGGMNTDYSGQIYSLDGEKTSSDLMQLFVAPTLAVKLNDRHSVGISLNLAYQIFNATGLNQFVNFKQNPGTGSSGLTDQGYDSSSGVGIKLGWIGKINDNATLGASYQSRTHMSRFNKYYHLFAEQGDFDIPSTFALGLAVKATPKTTVAFDIQKIRYSEVASVANPNNFNNTNTFLGDNDGKGYGWDDMTIYKLGISHQYNKNLTLRVGFNHGEQPIGADDTSFNVIALGIVEDHLTFGATWTLDNNAELSAYYMHAFENTVRGTGVAGGQANLTMDQHALGIGYGWNF
jgi:long-chain fatty acid transport protein